MHICMYIYLFPSTPTYTYIHTYIHSLSMQPSLPSLQNVPSPANQKINMYLKI